MMLTLPVQHPLGFRSAEPTSTAIGGRKAGSRRGAGCNRKHAAHRCYHQPRARRCTVKAAGSSADGGDLPLPAKESAERRKLLLKYVKEVQPALIEQFVERGPPAVVAAMKNTITNMLGTLPPQFFTVTISTVGENLSQLMLSVCMTGYMFRNVQYRLELRDALGSMGPAAATTAAAQNNQLDLYNSTAARQAYSTMERSQSAPVPSSVLDTEQYAPGVQKSRVQGDVLLWHKENGLETLDAVNYIELLEGEVSRLRQQLQAQQPQHQQLQQQLPSGQQQQQEQASPKPSALSDASLSAAAAAAMQVNSRQLPVPVSGQHALQQAGRNSHGPAGSLLVLEEAANELLDYLRCLDASSLAELTSSAGPSVTEAMDSFVARLMGSSDSDSLRRAGSECCAQELAKVMFWLMVVGYTLRGLEVQLDMQRSVQGNGTGGLRVSGMNGGFSRLGRGGNGSSNSNDISQDVW